MQRTSVLAQLTADVADHWAGQLLLVTVHKTGQLAATVSQKCAIYFT